MDYVFHGSGVQHLQTIEPQYSLLLKEHVIYASADLYIASLFLDKTGGDYFCSIWIDAGSRSPYLIERIENGIQLRYQQKKGSIYVLNKQEFKNREDIWKGEMISDHPVVPVKEIMIDDIAAYIYTLSELNKINIIPFSERHKYVQEDDTDLKELFRQEMKAAPTDHQLMQLVSKYHPGFTT